MHDLRRPPLRLALFPALGTLLLATGCSKDPGRYWEIEAKCSPCELQALARQSVAPGAFDCAADGGTAAEIETCAVKMAHARQTFIAEEKLQGIDSVIRAAYVGDDAGVRQLWLDSDRTGGSGTCRARVTQSTCGSLSASTTGHLCQEPREQKVICDEATSRVLQTELGGYSRDLWCAQDSEDRSQHPSLTCGHNKLFLESANALSGGGVTVHHPKGELYCSADAYGHGLLKCTRETEWRRGLGYFQADRVAGPLTDPASSSPLPAENQ